MKSARRPFPLWIVYGLVVFLFYGPMLSLFIGAFLRKEDSAWVWTWDWFSQVVNDESLMAALGNSLIVGLSAALISTVLGTAAALGLHRAKAWDAKTLNQLSLVSLFLPEIVMALSLLSWFFILQLEMGYFTVIIAHVTLTISYVILTVRARLSLLDPSLEEAAYDLGARPLQALWKVILPLLRPALASGFLLSFLISFDDFLITFFVNGVGQDTLPVKLYSSMKLGLSPKLNALSVLMLSVTVLVLLLFFRNRMIRDLLHQHEH